MARKYKNHTPEFKERAIKMSLDDKIPKVQIARNLGISPSTLDQWISKFEDGGDLSDSRRHGNNSSNKNTDKDRIRELEAKLKRAEDERDILKKAAAYFAKDIL